jgi:hypothetical protein
MRIAFADHAGFDKRDLLVSGQVAMRSRISAHSTAPVDWSRYF